MRKSCLLTLDLSAPVIDSYDNNALCERVVFGDQSAKTEFYNKYKHLVQREVYQFVRNSSYSGIIETEDYENEAWVYIFENLYKYNNRKAKISTFIVRQVQAGLCRYRENNSRTVRCPVAAFQLFCKIKKWENDYIRQNGEHPSEEMICETFRLKKNKYMLYTSFASGNMGNATYEDMMGTPEEINHFSMDNDSIDFRVFKDAVRKDEDLTAQDKEFIQLVYFDGESKKKVKAKLKIYATRHLLAS